MAEPPDADPDIRLCHVAVDQAEFAILSVPSEPADWAAELTEAEREVAARLIRGQSYADIARARGTARRTVAVQARGLYAKLGVSSSCELVSKFVSTLRRGR